jgi:hypothetical protein
VVIFLGVEALPGDTAQAILGQSATPQALENLRAEMGLDQPALTRYFHWLGGILTGDLGTALTNKADIAQVDRIQAGEHAVSGWVCCGHRRAAGDPAWAPSLPAMPDAGLTS